jgi:hypothetical protein
MRRKMRNNDFERRIPQRVRSIHRDTPGRGRRSTDGHSHRRRQRKHHNDDRARSHHIESLTTDRESASRNSGNPGRIAVPVGAFADPNFPAPRISVWEDRMHAWVGLPDEIKHSRLS